MHNNSSQDIKLSDLYQEVILDHNKRPRNFGKPTDANRYSHGVNPLCGDNYHLYLYVDEGGIIKKAGFEGVGCAISKASASMLTEAVTGKTVAEAEALKENVIHVLTDSAVTESVRTGAGKLKIFEGVKHFPIRVKCAALSWRALEDALNDKDKRKTEVSTE